MDRLNDVAVKTAISNFEFIALKESGDVASRLKLPFENIIKFIVEESLRCVDAEADCALVDAIFEGNNEDDTESLLQKTRHLSLLIEDTCPTMTFGKFNQLFGGRR